MIGILYLENRLSDLVFTSEKARMTELLASQAAISLENARLVDEMKVAKDQLNGSLKEKEVLLKEIHHRVKNNLQIIYSLLRLQSTYIKDQYDIEIFKDSQNRIRSMALIHEKLYQSGDLARIDFSEYTRSLTTYLLHSYPVLPETITMDIYIDNIFLSIDTAIPCGLLINELVSNCLKHAFPGGAKGKIRVELRLDRRPQEGDRLILIVSDNGIGFPENLDFGNTETLGLQLVMTLAKQLKGEIELDRTGGTELKVTFSPREITKQ